MGKKDTSKYAEAMRKRWADPKSRQRLSEALSKGQRGRYERPEERAKISESRAEWHQQQRAENWEQYSEEQGRRAALGISKRGAYKFTDALGRSWLMKSPEECSFAVWLDDKGLHWEYEPKTVQLANRHRYTPDFWVEEWRSFVELIGRYQSATRADRVLLAVYEGWDVLVIRELDTFFDWIWWARLMPPRQPVT